jgi:putative membrane protein
MYASALMAFLHHAAAFTVVAALAGEIALFRPPLTIAQARRLMVADNVFGAAAGVVLVIGLLRVAYFEKGPHYYWHDLFFLTKFAAFLVAALISSYPTVVFLSWRRNVKAGRAPQIPPECTRRVRRCLMLEFAAILVIVFCAAFMARGFGSLG